MGAGRLGLYIRTIKYLKSKQIMFRLFYAVRNRLGNGRLQLAVDCDSEVKFIKINDSPEINNISYDSEKLRFQFLNRTMEFRNNIDWNFGSYGKLWTYNLNYFQFLDHTTEEEGLFLIRDFISKKNTVKDGFEPYPISIRGVYWIRFLSKHTINDIEINSFLLSDYYWLIKNIEYHLMGNHLMENAFSLMFAGEFFQNKDFHRKGVKILEAELEEQILEDGAHFELSPMYHMILLHRLLDVYSILLLSDDYEEAFILLVKKKVISMISWLNTIRFSNNDFPQVNDSTIENGISINDLVHYAQQLNIIPTQNWELGKSGYRKWETDSFEIVIDIGNIGPDYQPGHAHADTFSYCVSCNRKLLIVDSGISTYEESNRRDWERSTEAHNTIVVNGKNSSEIWASFRVGNRARCTIIEEGKGFVKVHHDGYKRIGVRHQREFMIGKNSFTIVDSMISAQKKKIHLRGFIHLHPSVSVRIRGNEVVLNSEARLIFKNCINIQMEEYEYAEGFNKLVAAQRITYSPAMLNAQIHLELLHQ